MNRNNTEVQEMSSSGDLNNDSSESHLTPGRRQEMIGSVTSTDQSSMLRDDDLNMEMTSNNIKGSLPSEIDYAYLNMMTLPEKKGKAHNKKVSAEIT